jgi:hypothetical protein
VNPKGIHSFLFEFERAPFYLQKVGNHPIAKHGVGATFFDFDKLHDHPKAKFRNLASVSTLIKVKQTSSKYVTRGAV